jgi:hypothetical protein
MSKPPWPSGSRRQLGDNRRALCQHRVVRELMGHAHLTATSRYAVATPTGFSPKPPPNVPSVGRVEQSPSGDVFEGPTLAGKMCLSTMGGAKTPHVRIEYSRSKDRNEAQLSHLQHGHVLGRARCCNPFAWYAGSRDSTREPPASTARRDLRSPPVEESAQATYVFDICP